MNDKDAKKLERLTERYKKNNEKIKQNYDRVSIALPKGTKDRIKATGDTLNNFIINAVMEKLKAAEADLQQATQEAPQGTASGARTNRQAATKSATEGRTEAQEPKPRGRSRKASAANTEGPEEGTTAGSPAGSPDTARRETPQDLPGPEPVDAARDHLEGPETGTKGTDAPQHLTPGEEHLQQFNADHLLLYPYGTYDDIPPEELPFH